MPNYINLQNIYLVIAIFATVLFILKMGIFSIVGGDVEVDADFDAMSETDTSFDFLSLQSILAFLMGFGWAGLSALTQFNAGKTISIVSAFIFGLFCMFLSAYLMLMIKKLNQQNKVDLSECTDSVGKAYSSFAPKGEGQIEIVINNKLEVVDAINLSDEKIDSFTPIKVQKVENKKLYIVKN